MNKTTTLNIDLASLFANLPDNETNDPLAFTTLDAAEMLGVSESTARRRLRQAIKAGLIEPCTLKRASVHGVNQTIYGYRVIVQGE